MAGAGAWGERAGEMLKQFAEREGASIHRIDGLTMLTPPQFEGGRWCCWLFGEPRDGGVLAADFGLRPDGDLPAAFGHALTQLGESACGLLCDRFVVVALDRERHRCIVTRDPIGAQPLVHAPAAGGVVFAEHECDLIDLLPSAPSPDRLALLQWIENGLTPAGRSLYASLRRLPAGHRLVLDESHASGERWWGLRYDGIEEGNAVALASRVRDAALAAVGRAVAGSERPAVKLSGGLDSACVAAGLAAHGYADGRALAIGGTFSDYPVTDESELIEANARHTHLPLERIVFDTANSMLAPALAHIARWRVPPATPNLFLWQPLMARARELGVDLMLDGEGGDELFALAPYLIADRLREGRLCSAWSLAGRMPGTGPHPGVRVRLRTLRRFGVSPLVPHAVRRWRRARAGTRSTGSIVPRADARALAELDLQRQGDSRNGPLWWRSRAETLIDLRDRFDMGGHYRRLATDEGIDRRHPFLYDLKLIEVMLRLPPQSQFDPARDRVLLREGLDGLIPEAVRTRYVKSHFTPLVLAGIGADEAGLLAPLRRADAPVRAYVSCEALDRMLGASPEKRSMFQAGALWRVGIANSWLISQGAAGS